MKKCKTFHKKKTVLIFLSCLMVMIGLGIRVFYLMVVKSDYYIEKADELHEREREIKAARGRILDRNGVVLADNRSVCTVSVIHNQIKEPESVIKMLVKELGITEAEARKKVETISMLERVKTNVDKTTGDRIRSYRLDGVKVDEDFKRYYPYHELASKVLGFTGADNQGIIGLEVQYDDILQGINGKILTTTDARGIELEEIGEKRIEAIEGYDLTISMDYNIQRYLQQEAEVVMLQKEAEHVSILLMNPQNGELYGMVTVPEFNLNDPFTLQDGIEDVDLMWRNSCINDTYEPGSTFKIITAAAGLEAGVVTIDDTFCCSGYRIVENCRIHCHKRTGHGMETFLEGAQNSCNPVFIDVGLRLGVEKFYHYFEQFHLLDKTGIDLPGEASAIMHQKENVGPVELATISFGQSFQITPIQLAVTVSSIINGGNRVTPHFGMEVRDRDHVLIKELEYPIEKGIVSEKTSKEMCDILEKVVSEGSGKNAYIEGYEIGGKTATSQTLPRSSNVYIASFLGFAPADDPVVLGICIIHDPQGIYYGGTIAAPVMQKIFQNVLPYLNVESTVK